MENLANVAVAKESEKEERIIGYWLLVFAIGRHGITAAIQLAVCPSAASYAQTASGRKDKMDTEEVLCALSRRKGPNRWSYKGPLKFQAGSLTLVSTDSSSVRVNDGQASVRASFARRVAMEHAVTTRLEIPSKPPAWSDNAMLYGGSVGGGGREACYNAAIGDLYVGDPFKEGAYSREIILGMRLGWNDAQPVRQFLTNIFDRRALVTGYARGDSRSIEAMQIVYEGPAFHVEDERRSSLFDLMRFLSGRRGASWFTEAFDAKLRRIGFYFRNFGRAEGGQALQPVDLSVWSTEGATLEHSFCGMLEKMHDLRVKSRMYVAGAIHHYNDGSAQSYPISRLRDLAVAIEALAAAANGSQLQTVSWLETGFDERIAPVLQAFEGAFGDVSEDKCDILRLKIQQLNKINVASPREATFRLLESIGISLTRQEKNVIRSYRNGVLHSGHKGDESDVEILRRNDQAAALFANIFHRAFLAILGYPGKYCDAYDHESFPLRTAPKYALLAEYD